MKSSIDSSHFNVRNKHAESKSFPHQTLTNVTPKHLQTKSLWLMLCCQTVNLLTVAEQLTTWMLAITGLCLCWRALMNREQSTAPSKYVLIAFALAGIALLVITGKQLGLLLAMLHLLVFAYALKALELNNRSEYYQLSLLGIFILAISLLFQQTLYFAALVLLLISFNLVSLLQLFGAQTSLTKQYKSTLILILQSLPLAIALFIVFPKLPPFWKMPSAKSATTGISDNIKIGDIAKLALSDELAFRVNFNATAPGYSQLYWRGLVLDKFDGDTWQQANKPDANYVEWLKLENHTLSNSGNNTNDDQTNEANIISYQIFIEPTFQQWLFALDLAYDSVNEIVRTEQFNLYRDKPIAQTYSYQVSSDINATLAINITKHSFENNINLPNGNNPRLRAEAIRLRQLYSDDADLVAAVLQHFNKNDYYYSLEPNQLNGHRLDQFYFDTRIGFCEHYATSFVYLMRAAGIPARVVVGYLGGEYNPQAGYYSVYQRDAHAWAEIWQKGKGWVRIDPTAAVDPSRIENGFNEQLLSEQANYSDSLFTFNTYKQFAFLNNMRLQLAAIDYQWTKWVVGYSNDKQNKLLKQWLGKVKPWKIALIIASVLFSVMLLLAVYHFYRHRSLKEKASKVLYKKSLLIIEKHNITKPASMAALDFAKVVTEKAPNLSVAFNEITNLFIQLECAPLTNEQYQQTLNALKQKVKLLK